jgi:hypothetical protein
MSLPHAGPTPSNDRPGSAAADLDAVQQLLTRWLAETERLYAAQAGSTAMCELHKDGRVTGGLKYEEGRLVALRAAQRVLTQATVRTVDDLRASLQQSAGEWAASLARYASRERPPLPWLAYSQGGFDAVSSVLALIDTR